MVRLEHHSLLGSLGLDRAMFVRAVLPWVKVKDLVQLMLTSHAHLDLLEERNVALKLLSSPKILHWQLARRVRNIQHLELEAMALYKKAFSDFETYFTNLQSLKILPQHNYEEKLRKGMSNIIPGTLPFSLTSLDISTLYEDCPAHSREQNTVQELTQHCNKIQHYKGPFLPQHFSQLHSLSLRNRKWQECRNKLLSIMNPPLREVCLKDVSVEDAEEILAHFTTIRKICCHSDQSSAWIDNDDQLQFLEVFVGDFIALAPILQGHRQIKVFKPRSLNHQLTAENLTLLASSLPNLKFLDLSRFTTIHALAYQNIAQLIHLEWLHLPGKVRTNPIPDEAFRAITTNCPLSWLQINHTCTIQNGGLHHLSSLTRLTRLDAANNMHFQSEYLASIPPSVTHLNLFRMKALNFETLFQCTMRCTQLTYLNIKTTACDSPQEALLTCVTNMVKLRELVISKGTKQYLDTLK